MNSAEKFGIKAGETVRFSDFGCGESIVAFHPAKGDYTTNGYRCLASRGVSTGWKWDLSKEEISELMSLVTEKVAVCG